MANETSLRSYRDYDAYDRDARDREPAAAGRQGGDPLADLARIMGQDDTYSDLLKSIARTRAEPVFEAPEAEAADEQAEADETYDLPAMPLRGAAAEEGIDWEDLEAELAKHREAAADEDYAEEPIDELRGSHELWHGEAAAHDELDRRLHEEFGRSFAASDENGRMPAGAYVAAGAGAAVALGAAAYALRPGQQAGRQDPPPRPPMLLPHRRRRLPPMAATPMPTRSTRLRRGAAGPASRPLPRSSALPFSAAAVSTATAPCPAAVASVANRASSAPTSRRCVSRPSRPRIPSP